MEGSTLRHRLIAAVLGLAGLAPAPAPAVVYYEDDRVQASREPGAPYSGIGVVQNLTAWIEGTGFVVGDCHVVTNRHIPAPGWRQHDINPRLEFRSSRTRIATAFVVASGENSIGTEDWALLRIDPCLGAEMSQFSIAVVEPRDLIKGAVELQLGGFPADRPRNQLWLDPSCRAYASEQGWLHHDCSGAFGTSGGPIFFEAEDGRRWVVAIDKHGPDNRQGSGFLEVESFEAALLSSAILTHQLVEAVRAHVPDADIHDPRDLAAKLADPGEHLPASYIDSLRASAETGSVRAMMRLAALYDAGRGVEQDLITATNWLAKAGDAGNGSARTQLARRLLAGHGAARNPEAAAAWLREGVAAQSPEAMVMLGQLHLDGNGVVKDVARGVDLISRAAEAGYPNAQVVLGQLYEAGLGVDRDASEAMRWFTTAAKLGHRDATQWVDEKVAQLEAEARRGDEAAQIDLAALYHEGSGVPRDWFAAGRWYSAAADQGNARAQRKLEEILGRVRRWGERDRDPPYLAIQGRFLLDGIGGPRDIDKGTELIKAAAEAGDPMGQFILGAMFEAGIGVDKDLGRATIWYATAAEKGNPDAVRAIARLTGGG